MLNESQKKVLKEKLKDKDFGKQLEEMVKRSIIKHIDRISKTILENKTKKGSKVKEPQVKPLKKK